jgi:hypothetical protein
MAKANKTNTEKSANIHPCLQLDSNRQSIFCINSKPPATLHISFILYYQTWVMNCTFYTLKLELYAPQRCNPFGLHVFNEYLKRFLTENILKFQYKWLTLLNKVLYITNIYFVILTKRK